MITLVKILPSYIGANQYVDWVENFHNMNWKTQSDFMTIEPRKRDYGAVDAVTDAFIWHVPALDSEEDYIRDCKIWDKNLAAGIKQWKEYVNNGEYLFLTIQGQVEPSLWDKTKDDARFAAILMRKQNWNLFILLEAIWAPTSKVTIQMPEYYVQRQQGRKQKDQHRMLLVI